MPEFFANTSKGLGEALEKEFIELGFEKVRRVGNGVFFESNWEGCYRANLHSRIASRVLKPVWDFPAYQLDEFFSQILKHDFTKHIRLPFSLKVDATIEDCKIHDQRMVALKTKDAICDQFRNAFGSRPDVDKLEPDFCVHVRGIKNQFSIAIDTSGDSLYRRGYRERGGVAPMRENLAAGLLQLSEWDEQSPLIDPMCGSGTFLIEAAQKKFRIAPGSFRRRFGFQKLIHYQKEVWESMVQKALNEELTPEPGFFFGYDEDAKMLKVARQNADRAGVGSAIRFARGNVATLQQPDDLKLTGSVITNPPYGLRLGEVDQLRDVYRDLGYSLKRNFPGWTAWILSGEKELTKDLRMASEKRIPVHNGNVECRFLKYVVKDLR